MMLPHSRASLAPTPPVSTNWIVGRGIIYPPYAPHSAHSGRACVRADAFLVLFSCAVACIYLLAFGQDHHFPALVLLAPCARHALPMRACDQITEGGKLEQSEYHIMYICVCRVHRTRDMNAGHLSTERRAHHRRVDVVVSCFVLKRMVGGGGSKEGQSFVAHPHAGLENWWCAAEQFHDNARKSIYTRMCAATVKIHLCSAV